MYVYRTHGTCSQAIEIETEGNVIRSIRFIADKPNLIVLQSTQEMRQEAEKDGFPRSKLVFPPEFFAKDKFIAQIGSPACMFNS